MFRRIAQTPSSRKRMLSSPSNTAWKLELYPSKDHILDLTFFRLRRQLSENNSWMWRNVCECCPNSRNEFSGILNSPTPNPLSPPDTFRSPCSNLQPGGSRAKTNTSEFKDN
ncbi:hypothetical protein CDAR_105311 [Caerostris darwini]|uniref:Uncharacterized protein n=1 Tax=Caerostris darwini TaxID=1538125 RepID=A0AAV4SHR4_9ARAC|nr:hypothetical protein CDAR_105311 [Caerostris darwini]